jgi:phosphatidylinositol-3,4,5-trisphosphate 3-phosphatase/dual-specificity protein phosphatase PTEN
MNWLRKIVSGKRNRFKDQNYNLDITYITDRVLAMSFPASGIEQMYRNNISDVSYFTKMRYFDR